MRGRDSSSFSLLYTLSHTEEYSIKGFKPQVIVDVGANIGDTALCLNYLYPDSKIFALEPNEANFELLTKNTRQKKNIIPLNAGIWKETTELYLSGDGVSSSLGTENTSKAIQVFSLADFMSNHDISNIDLLKIDVEGAEKEIFEHVTEEVMDKVNAIFIELHDNKKNGCGNAFFSAMAKQSRIYFIRGENILALKSN